MKTVFVTAGEAPVMHTLFRTQFWNAFCDRHADARIVVLVKPEKKALYEKELAREGVIVEALAPRFNTRFTRIMSSLAHSALYTQTNVWEMMRAYARGDVSLPVTIAKRIYQVVLGRWDWYKHILRTLFLWTKSTHEVEAIFDRYLPEVLFSTSLTQFGFDVPVAREAKRRGMRIVGMVRSWDNLTSHGVLRVVPDVFIFQNVFLRDMAVRYQAIDPAQIPLHVVGLPHYDAYQDKSLLVSREIFCEEAGLDPTKKIILYGAMGDFLFPNEGTVADVFEKLITNGSIAEHAQVLFRAHPRFTSPLERLESFTHVKGDRHATYTSNDLGSMELRNADMRYLINSLYHADVVVTGASTIALDAVACDRPTVCIGFDGTAHGVSYWLSVKRFYEYYTHFMPVVASGGVRVVEDAEALAAAVHAYLADPHRDSTGRVAIKHLFMEPYDGHAAERLAEVVSEAL